MLGARQQHDAPGRDLFAGRDLRDGERGIADGPRQAALPALIRPFGQEQVTRGKGMEDEPMGHHREMAVQSQRQPLYFFPDPIDALVELFPGLPARRREALAKEILLEFGVGRAAQIAEIPFLEQGLGFHFEAQGFGEHLGRHGRTSLVAGQDMTDRMPAESPSEPTRLVEPPFAERGLRDLDNAVAVARCLAMADQVDGHGESLAPVHPWRRTRTRFPSRGRGDQ